MYKQYPFYVSKSFRDYLLQLCKTEENLKLMQYILIALHSHKTDIIFSRDIIESCFSCDKNYSTAQAACDFQKATSINLNLNNNYKYIEKKSCTINPTLPSQILDKFATENSVRLKDKENAVNLISGESYSDYKVRKEIKAYNQFLSEEADKTIDKKHQAYELYNLLKRQDSKIVAGVISSNFEKSFELAKNITNQKRKQNALLSLQKIDKNKETFYHAVRNTPRLYSSSALPFLKRELRKSLLAGCVELDLASSQLAIFNSISKSELLNKCLDCGFWKELCNELNVDIAYKNDLKSLIYGLLYGSSIANLVDDIYMSNREITHVISKAELLQKAQSSTILAEILSCRKRVCKQFRISHKQLNTLMQKIELQIMLKMLPTLLKYEDECTIMVWLHDGITLKFDNKTTQKKVVKHLKVILDNYLKREKINSNLEITYL